MALLPHYYCKHKNSEFDHLLNYIVPVPVCVLLTGNIWRTDFGRRLSNPLSWTRNVHWEENGETSGRCRGETNRRSSATDACLAKTEIVKITPRSNRMTILGCENIWRRNMDPVRRGALLHPPTPQIHHLQILCAAWQVHKKHSENSSKCFLYLLYESPKWSVRERCSTFPPNSFSRTIPAD